MRQAFSRTRFKKGSYPRSIGQPQTRWNILDKEEKGSTAVGYAVDTSGIEGTEDGQYFRKWTPAAQAFNSMTEGVAQGF